VSCLYLTIVQVVQKLLTCVLRGLSVLHSAGLTHGAVHPNNVLLTGTDGSAVLAEYDFTKSPVNVPHTALYIITLTYWHQRGVLASEG